MEFITHNRPEMDLRELENEKFFIKSQKDINYGLDLLNALLSSLPRRDWVFIAIDSLSCISGNENDADRIIRRLKRIMDGSRRITIKLLVTDPADVSLHARDSVSGAWAFEILEETEGMAEKLLPGRLMREGKGESGVGNFGMRVMMRDRLVSDDQKSEAENTYLGNIKSLRMKAGVTGGMVEIYSGCVFCIEVACGCDGRKTTTLLLFIHHPQPPVSPIDSISAAR